MIYRNLALQALVGVMAVSLLAAKGCTVDGDASLGDDEKPDASAGASAGKGAGTAGKTGSIGQGGATLEPGTAGKTAAEGGATLAGTGRLMAAPGSAAQEIKAASSVRRFAYGPAIAIGSMLAVLTAW